MSNAPVFLSVHVTVAPGGPHETIGGQRAGDGCGVAARKVPVDAVRVVDAALLSLSRRAALRGVRLERVSRAKSWAVLSDPKTLGDTLVQLGLNAIAASPAGGLVSISLMHSSFATTDISVFNTGRALDAAGCARALTPLGQPCAAGGEGTGIGLSIARVGIERLGGTISLRGDPVAGGTIAAVTVATASSVNRTQARDDSTAPAAPRSRVA